MDTWVAYAPVKNNPEDAAKVKLKPIAQLTPFCIFFWITDMGNKFIIYLIKVPSFIFFLVLQSQDISSRIGISNLCILYSPLVNFEHLYSICVWLSYHSELWILSLCRYRRETLITVLLRGKWPSTVQIVLFSERYHLTALSLYLSKELEELHEEYPFFY